MQHFLHGFGRCCCGVFIGFESPDVAGLAEVGKKLNVQKGRDFKVSVRQIQRHGILVVGSFIMGLDVDGPGIGQQIASTANRYGVDMFNVLFLTPLPCTRLWDKMESEGRIAANSVPGDWKYCTLTFPVVRHNHLRRADILRERDVCNRRFYFLSRTLRLVWGNIWAKRRPIITLVSNLSFRNNLHLDRKAYLELDLSVSLTQMHGQAPLRALRYRPERGFPKRWHSREKEPAITAGWWRAKE